ncbi:PE domain-containing protein [Mycobacterium sp.]|uniref:PE domain-containing protein n=1 Tax=Mycobacterium sp. TaxID=1785 RepID=UPI003A858915
MPGARGAPPVPTAIATVISARGQGYQARSAQVAMVQERVLGAAPVRHALSPSAALMICWSFSVGPRPLPTGRASS